MGIGEAPAIAAALLANGKSRSLPVAVVENASLPDQRIVYTTLVQLPTLALHEFTGPTLLLVGPQFGARATLLQRAEADRCRPSKAAREKHG